MAMRATPAKRTRARAAAEDAEAAAAAAAADVAAAAAAEPAATAARVAEVDASPSGEARAAATGLLRLAPGGQPSGGSGTPRRSGRRAAGGGDGVGSSGTCEPPGCSAGASDGGPPTSGKSAGREKQPWKSEEIERLAAVMARLLPAAAEWEESGMRPPKSIWALAADELPGRTPKQVAERWKQHHMPGLAPGPWSRQEEYVLASMHAKIGNAWSVISHYLPRRSSNATKNHFMATSRIRSAARISSLLRIYTKQLSLKGFRP
eukprot:362814-Chlamydomonas_euryale.AAC.5